MDKTENDVELMDNWQIREDNFDIHNMHYKETLFTQGNGYLGTRGAFEEGYLGQQAATLIHGVFDDVPISVTELANTPNWIDLRLHAGGEMFRMERSSFSDYRRWLDLHTGVLYRTLTWQLPSGSLKLTYERFASLADEHLLLLRLGVESVDFEGPLEFRAALPGHMHNNGYAHWEWLDQGPAGKNAAFLSLQTRLSGIQLVEAFHLAFENNESASTQLWDALWSPELVLPAAIRPGEKLSVIKRVAVYTSRDTQAPNEQACKKLQQATHESYTALYEANCAAWEKDWQTSNISIEGDDEADLAVRYGLFQLLIAAPRHNEHVSIAAKSLSGYGYKGHAFWDTEIFVLPFFTYTQPKIARNLLMYRYHTLPGARRKAAAMGLEGACFAWESASTGDETTPRWVPAASGELVRIWCGDIELHISADIAYAVYQYWRVTGDDNFMRQFGAEIVLDTARFWGSRFEWHAERARYEISDVIGPDENHDHVNNNAYTNGMAAWNIRTALEILEWLRKEAPQKAAGLESTLDLSSQRLDHWRDILKNMYTGFDPKTGLYEQFEGYFKLEQVDLPSLEPRTISVQALLGIDGAQKVKVIKQPDVLMLLYLLKDQVDQQVLKDNWEYYTPQTDLSYGSSLGPSIQAILASRLGHIDQAYQNFIHAARTDIQDERGNSADGIHAATNGGLWQAVVFGFAGLHLSGSGPQLDPHLPEHWKRLKLHVRYHGQSYDFDLQPGSLIQIGRARSRPGFPIQGAIFDLDGVLTDTSELHYRGWKRLADEEGLPFNRQDNEALRGVSRRESLLLLLKGKPYPEEKLQEFMERKNRYYLESIADLTPKDLLPGARQLLEELRKAGVRIAIGSGSKNSKPVLERLGIAPLLDAISDGYSVKAAKPAPDLFLHAASQLGLSPQHCVVFEDAQAGVEAALAGGMWAVGIGPMQRVGEAHLVIPGLYNIHWQVLIDRLKNLSQPT